MGKHKRRKRNSSTDELNERLRILERRLHKRSRHTSPDDYYERRSVESRSRSRSAHHHNRRSYDQSSRPRRHRRSPSQSPEYINDIENNICQAEKQEGGPNPGEIEDPPSEIIQEDSQDPTLPANIEGLLGPEGTPSINNAVDLHESLAKRWTVILQDGLNTDVKSNIVKKYDRPNNCSLLVPPKINEKISAAMNESGLKRDKRICDQQSTLAAAITAVGKTLNGMIASQQSVQDIETLSDSARLLCEIFHENSITRRSLILPGLNKDVKELMEKSSISEFLFGDKLQDKVNASKAVKKSAQELKNTPAQPKPANKVKTSLNYQGPQRQLMPPRLSGQKPKLRRPTYQAPGSRMNRYKRSPQRHQQYRRQGHSRR